MLTFESHTPLTSETEHMINRDAMRLMKPSAIIINAARGPIWDERDLYEALKEGTIAPAGSDVFEQEPPDARFPLFELPELYCIRTQCRSDKGGKRGRFLKLCTCGR